MATNERNHDMEHQFNELRHAISKDLDERFLASEQRLTDNLTQVVVQQLETAQQHLEGRLQMHMEDLKGVVTRGLWRHARNNRARSCRAEPEDGYQVDGKVDSLGHKMKIEFEETRRVVNLGFENVQMLDEKIGRRFDAVDRL